MGQKNKSPTRGLVKRPQIYSKKTSCTNRAAVFSDIIKLPHMNTTVNYYKPIQLKLPVDYQRIIDINDPVYSFLKF